MAYAYNGREIRPSVELYHDAVPYAAGISMKDFFLDKERCAYAWREGSAILKHDIGDICPMRDPMPPPLSYGHLVCLGAPVAFPEHGEPNVRPFASSIDEAIDIMDAKTGADFTQNELFQYYLELWRYLKPLFPEADMPFSGFSCQGPLTTAVLMRGQDFLMDVYDEPGKSKKFLRQIADSLNEYEKTVRRINNQPEKRDNVGFVDDFASLIPPYHWQEFVVPFINARYESAGNKGAYCSIHVENLVPAHLPHLNALGLSHFQPSVSPALTLTNVKANLDPRIEFDWLLYMYEVISMTDAEIQAWVDETVAAGVTSVRTQIGAYALSIGKADRLRAFNRALEKYRV